MKLSKKETISYGLGAVGKDMVYMLSASYVLYYYQDILGVSAFAMGVILMAARIFDAFNDPVMGVIVAKTRTRWGRFRPWLLIGTCLNAVVLYLMFAAPPALSGNGLIAYAAVFYILWGGDIYHDGYSLLVHDPCLYRGRKGKREPDDHSTLLCWCWLGTDYSGYYDLCAAAWKNRTFSYDGKRD